MRGLTPTAEQLENPGMGLAASLGLVALVFLPLINGGYSSGLAYQVGFVLMPLAAGFAWLTMPNRPRLVQPLLIAYCLVLPFMPWILQGGREIWYTVLLVPAAWVITWACLRHAPDRRGYLLPGLVLAGIITSLIGIYLWIGAGTLHYQIYSVFGLHNSYAGYLLLIWPLALVAAAEAKRPLWRWLYCSAGLLLVATLILTYSRASWAVLGLQFLGFVAWLIWRRSGNGNVNTAKVAAVFAGAFAACAAVLLALPPGRDTLSRLFDFAGYSFQGRLRFWDAALEIFSDAPLGSGLGSYAYIYPQFQKDYIYYSIDPHSWPLQLLSELGIFGAVIAIGVIVGVALWVKRLWQATGGSLVAVLLIAGVLGSLIHAAVDFDYYFGAVTALLGVLLAYGAHLSSPPEPPKADTPVEETAAERKQRLISRLGAGLALVLLLAAAGYGIFLTLERYQLDHLRDNPALAGPARLNLLENAVRYNPFNHKTHYKLASYLGLPGEDHDRERALAELDLALRLNPNYAQGWALKALLCDDPATGDGYLEKALRLDPYNYPDHYFYYANLAQSDEEKRDRLLLGLEMIPAEHPVRPDHVRPTWHDLNPMWAEWYYELARLSDDPEQKKEYRRIGTTFQGYWEGVLREREPRDGE